MLASLKDHPFAVEAFFKHSLVLTFAAPKAVLEPYLPECLTLDTHDDRWGFLAVALVDTRHLRPKGFPQVLGNDFILVGFRLFVRYTNNAGKRLRGLYILKSETNKRLMALAGNFFTHYNYTFTDIASETGNHTLRFHSEKSDFDITVDRHPETAVLPVGSPFADWKEARRFAGPLPFTFTYEPETQEVLIIEGVRENWTPQPVNVLQHHIGFVEKLNLPGLVLANAFIIENIPYLWEKGKKERWNG